MLSVCIKVVTPAMGLFISSSTHKLHVLVLSTFLRALYIQYRWSEYALDLQFFSITGLNLNFLLTCSDLSCISLHLLTCSGLFGLF